MLTECRSVLVLLSAACVSAHAEAKSSTNSKIRSEVAEIVAGINAKDIDKATKYDAPDLVSMESGARPLWAPTLHLDHDDPWVRCSGILGAATKSESDPTQLKESGLA